MQDATSFSDDKKKRLRLLAVIAIAAVSGAIGAWLASDRDPDDVVFEAPEPAPAEDLADPALAGAWKPVGFWVDGDPVAELILNGSTMRVEFMDPAQRGRRSRELVVRGVDATPAGKDQLRGLTAELLGGWGVPSADIGTMVEFGYRREGDVLRLAWSMEDPS